MSRISVFSAPFLLGFDSFEERIDRLARSAEGYPPYNIERSSGDDGAERFLISIAVAGFARADLDVSVEDNQLMVRGKQADEPSRDFLHRGIAARQFQRTFLLADGMEVKDATLGHGMLVITLERPRALKIARQIDIRSL
ncbi:Molecular chaperone IbpA, HSP20 family [Devosia lucknowensis]|uniref:Molecular chaperone IbpA, HSP20 family n=1 Tax=Devosia lucknowensis TaxID=1096929 RepID=A0A1Y6G6U2_9HYPH|nr:Hsp20 family protein [Devosia lucknowensis]SMQ85826.1 Molecular chaperone IbpA, HSP20 family [Devosia lucknowensis]